MSPKITSALYCCNTVGTKYPHSCAERKKHPWKGLVAQMLGSYRHEAGQWQKLNPDSVHQFQGLKGWAEVQDTSSDSL